MENSFQAHTLKTPISWGSKFDSEKSPNCQTNDAESGEPAFILNI